MNIDFSLDQEHWTHVSAERLAATGVCRVEDAEFGLLFRPNDGSDGLLFLVAVVGGEVAERPFEALLSDVHLAIAPVVTGIEAPFARRAQLVRFLASAEPGSDRAELAGVAAVLEFACGSVLLRSEPTSSVMVAVVEPSLREMLATMQLRAAHSP